MMKHLYKYRWEYCLLMFFVSVGLIVLDYEYFCNPVGNAFQWIVALSYLAIYFTLQWCITDKSEVKPIETTRVPEQKEYVFIWYKKLVNGTVTHYTQPFRTSVKAATYFEARDKVADIALQRMTLVIVDEAEFKRTHLFKLRNSFNELNKKFNHLFKDK